jgi:uncharacterized protein with HEPN domain
LKNKDAIIIQKINEYCRDIQKIVVYTKFDDFFEDITVNRAAAMTLQQIGELSKKLSDDVKSRFNKINWADIRGLRNRIAHDYEGINWQIVWETIEEDIPKLLSYTEEILKDL